jgi:hypothetical protein
MPLSNIKYVTTGTWGPGIARPLTAAEADSNIHSLAQGIADVIASGVEGVGIANITVTGSQMVFYLTDGTTKGPYGLPTAQANYRGFWEAATSYSAMDIVQVLGFGTYMVAYAHLSGPTFSPAASGAGGAFYVQIGPETSLVAETNDVSSSTIVLGEINASQYLRVSTTTGTVVEVPAGVFPVNVEIHFRQVSVGAIELVAAEGVIINVPAGFDPRSEAQGATFTLKCVAPDEWDLFGAIAATV